MIRPVWEGADRFFTGALASPTRAIIRFSMHPSEERSDALKKLRKRLAMAPDHAFFDLCWAVDALQSGQAEAAARHLSFPPGAADARFSSPLGVYPWELETLIGELLIAPKALAREGPNRVLNCSSFGAMTALINPLRKLENAESGLYLRRVNILDELHRIAQREFPWQSGYFNRVQFYRNSYIYGGERCAEFFVERYGVSQNAVSALGFGLYSYFREHPVMRPRSVQLESLGISPKEGSAALSLIGAPFLKAKYQFQRDIDYVKRRWKLPPPIAYRPSILRRYPVIAFPRALRAPLPELILERVTSGFYYDLLPGGQKLRNEASRRFERYCRDLLERLMPGLEATGDHHYWRANQRIRSPDVLVKVAGELAIVIECKASKLSFDAQYSEDPISIARVGYQELAKGVLQLWRYFAHTRLGLTDRVLGSKVYGIVLTLDTWMMMSRELRKQVIDSAHAMASGTDIEEQDKKPIVFCSVKDFESTLLQSDENGLLLAVEKAATESFTGWLLADVHRDAVGGGQSKDYPFEMRDVLGWVRALDAEAERLGRKMPTTL